MKTSFLAVLHIGSSKDSKSVLLLAGRIMTALTVNKTIFPAPDPSLTEFNDAITLLDTYIKSRDGSERINQSIASQSQIVYDQLKQIAAYVNKIAKGDKAIIIQSGFDFDNESTGRSIPEKVIIKRVENGSTEHSVKIFVFTVSDADRYMVEITTTPADAASWKIAINAVPSNRLEIQDLERGVEIFIRVTAGNTHGWGLHSDVTSYIPQ